MERYLISQNQKSFKANLHCHSNLSDGMLSPQEIKEIYAARGYSIVAYTDHDILIPHPELNDASFLALNGFEMEINAPHSNFTLAKTCHLCYIALDPDNVTQVCWDQRYLFGNAKLYADRVQHAEGQTEYTRYHTPECINDMIRRGREAGFFVTYNHPAWSLEDYRDYGAYEGMSAMEISNTTSNASGFIEYNDRVYDDMLRAGKRIYCIAADDNHNHRRTDSPGWDSCGGCTVIKADRLDYPTIADSLKNGNFYATEGPEIHDLWYDGETVHVTCSPVKQIRFLTMGRHTRLAYSEDCSPITRADFKPDDCDEYFRVVLIDQNGRMAHSNAYFLDELKTV